MPPYSLDTLRTFALHTQGLASRREPTPENIYQVVEKIGAVQIDTLQMVHRSQYLLLWSRFGTYDTADFDKLMFDPQERRLFEYWWHAACIIPLSEYRYRLPKMNKYKNGGSEGYNTFFHQPESIELRDKILAYIQENGEVRSADFERDGAKRGTWWDWKPSKQVLEHLFNAGELMIANRIKFQRVYDLTERVLPDWVDTTVPGADETKRHLLEVSLKAQGVCLPKQTADYTYMTYVSSHIQQLIEDGIFVEIKGILYDGKEQTLVVHKDNLETLQKVADGAIKAEHTTFLTPFDSVFWAKNRDKQLWNFHQTLEAYKPAPIRQWGYFCLPILHKNRFVGRFDPKLDRKKGELILRAVHLEPDVVPDDELVADVAVALRDFMKFHKAKTLVIEKSNPPEFGKKLEKAL